MIAQQAPNIFSMTLTFLAILFSSAILIKTLASVFRKEIENQQKIDKND